MKSLFKSESGKKKILDLYDDKLEELQISCTTRYIDTTFGSTHVIVTGDAAKPPLIIVHGSNGCAPIALECYPNLCSKFQVFAIDVLAQPNKSAETRLSMKDDSYGKWMNEIVRQLEVRNVVLAGFSFGGLIILKTLSYNGEHIKEAFLASPAYIVNGNPLIALWKIFIPMKRYMQTKKSRHVEKFLSAVFTDRDEFALKFLSRVLLDFEMDFTPVPVISMAEAEKIDTPITILAAREDILFPGVKMIKRSKKLFSSMKNMLLLDNSKHVQSTVGNRTFEKLILDSIE